MHKFLNSSFNQRNRRFDAKTLQLSLIFQYLFVGDPLKYVSLAQMHCLNESCISKLLTEALWYLWNETHEVFVNNVIKGCHVFTLTFSPLNGFYMIEMIKHNQLMSLRNFGEWSQDKAILTTSKQFYWQIMRTKCNDERVGFERKHMVIMIQNICGSK